MSVNDVSASVQSQQIREHSKITTEAICTRFGVVTTNKQSETPHLGPLTSIQPREPG